MYTADPGERPGSGSTAGVCRCRAARCSAARPASTTWRMSAAIPATSTPGPKAAPPAGATTTSALLPEERGAGAERRHRRSTPTRTTPTARSASRCAPRCCRRASDFVEAAVAAGIPRGDYNGRDRGGPAGVVSLPRRSRRDGQAVEHLSRVPRRRGRAPAEPDDHHRRAGDARAPRGRRRDD